MTKEELIEKITSNFSGAVAELTESKNTDFPLFEDQYNISGHSVMQTTKRPDKTFKNEKGETEISKVSRLPLPLQKVIVSQAATILCGNPILLDATTSTPAELQLLSAIEKVWEDNKLDYRSKRIAKLMMSETEAAEIWYAEPVDVDEDYWGDVLPGARFKLRMRIIANSLGDTLIPVFNSMGDMVAFCRSYKVGKDGRFDVYTDSVIYKGIKPDGGEWSVKSEVNIFNKIPVIYYSQPDVEWADVQPLIERLEKLLSDFADTNDYFASPLLLTSGEILSFVSKGETGKVVNMGRDAKVDYLTWDNAPENIKLEIKTLINAIYDYTSTKNLTAEELQGLGAYSGIALKMLFLPAHMKASDKEEFFGESIQRRINFIKAAIGVLSVPMAKVQLSIKPKFEYFLPKDDMERLDAITTSISAGIMSIETGVRQNPLIYDTNAEIEKIEQEKKSGLDSTFNE